MTRIITVTQRSDIRRAVELAAMGSKDVLAVGDDPLWTRKVSALLPSLEPGTLLVIPSGGMSYVEREDIRIVRYGNLLRKADEGIFYPGGEPGRLLRLPEGRLGEICFALMTHFGLPDDFFSSFVPAEESVFTVASAAEVATVLSYVPLSCPVVAVLDASSYREPVQLARSFERASFLLVRRNGIEGESKFLKAVDRMIFSPVMHKLSSISFFSSDSELEGLLNGNIKCIRIFLRSEE